MGNLINSVASRFSGITPWDVFDILLLSVLFFSVYYFVRRRRAFAALVGVAVFIGVRFGVKALGLAASSQFFEYFYKVGPVVLIIVFQADIRSMLEKIGGFVISLRRKLKRLFNPKSQSREVEAIIKAVTRLSSKSTGALIVFERNTGVDEIAEKGVVLDALISSELICNIFYSPAPLHDGAIVIRGKRIHSAACMLPSYTEPSLDSEFGSRHRAAIGMSRSSDAIVIVVSEETGIVSCAQNGELETRIDFGKLRDILNVYYGVRDKKANSKKK